MLGRRDSGRIDIKTRIQKRQPMQTTQRMQTTQTAQPIQLTEQQMKYIQQVRQQNRQHQNQLHQQYIQQQQLQQQYLHALQQHPQNHQQIHELYTQKLQELRQVVPLNVICNKDLLECIGIELGIELKDEVKFVGSGGFGAILSYSTEWGNSIAIKFIISNSILDGINDPESDIRKELEYTYEMGFNGIGPRVLGAFNYNLPRGQIKKFPHLFKALKIISNEYDREGQNNKIRNIIYGESKFIAQCVIMEQYTTDCHNALQLDEFTPREKIEIIKQMIYKLYQQSKINIYCSDLKPANYVVKKDSDVITVGMIDFGADFCMRGNIYKLSGFRNGDGILDANFTYLDFFYITCLVQLYMMTRELLVNNDHINYREDAPVYTASYMHRNVIPLFFDNDTSRKFFAYNYNQRMTILNHVLKIGNLDKAVTNLFYYTNASNKRTHNQHIKFVADILENVSIVMMRIWNRL